MMTNRNLVLAVATALPACVLHGCKDDKPEPPTPTPTPTPSSGSIQDILNSDQVTVNDINNAKKMLDQFKDTVKFEDGAETFQKDPNDLHCYMFLNNRFEDANSDNIAGFDDCFNYENFHNSFKPVEEADSKKKVKSWLSPQANIGEKAVPDCIMTLEEVYVISPAWNLKENHVEYASHVWMSTNSEHATLPYELSKNDDDKKKKSSFVQVRGGKMETDNFVATQSLIKLTQDACPHQAYFNGFVSVVEPDVQAKSDIDGMKIFEATAATMKIINTEIADANYVECQGVKSWNQWKYTGKESDDTEQNWSYVSPRPVITGAAEPGEAQILEFHNLVNKKIEKVVKGDHYRIMLKQLGMFDTEATAYKVLAAETGFVNVCMKGTVLMGFVDCQNAIMAKTTVAQKKELFQTAYGLKDVDGADAKQYSSNTNVLRDAVDAIETAMQGAFLYNENKLTFGDMTFAPNSWSQRLELFLLDAIRNQPADYDAFWPKKDAKWSENTEAIREKFIEDQDVKKGDHDDVAKYPLYDGKKKSYKSNSISTLQVQKMTNTDAWNQAQIFAILMQMGNDAESEDAPVYYLAYSWSPKSKALPDSKNYPDTDDQYKSLRKQVLNGEVTEYRTRINEAKSKKITDGWTYKETIRKIPSSLIFNGDMKGAWDAVATALTAAADKKN